MIIPKELDWKFTPLRKVVSLLRCAQRFFGETQNGKFNSSGICKSEHQGEPIMSIFTLSNSHIKTCSISKCCSVPTVMAEEAGLIKPPTSP